MLGSKVEIPEPVKRHGVEQGELKQFWKEMVLAVSSSSNCNSLDAAVSWADAALEKYKEKFYSTSKKE